MENYGLLGKHLEHSISPEIHTFLYEKLSLSSEYKTIEIPECDLSEFILGLKDNIFSGLNVTIPYKEAVLPHIDRLDPLAECIQSVNTIKIIDNNIYGYNTDYHGIEETFKSFPPVSEREFTILGTGGASKPVIKFLVQNNAKKINIISRDPKKFMELHINNTCINYYDYEELSSLSGNGIVNATPVGMYPNIDTTLINENIISKYDFAFDFVYNPYETLFLKIAKKSGLKTQNGLKMLVFQAIKSFEIWNDLSVSDEIKYNTFLKFWGQYVDEPIILVGMPGSGKSTVGEKLAQFLDYEFIDLDMLIEKMFNITVEDAFKNGEQFFRSLETQALETSILSKKTVISTGGGIINIEKNREILSRLKYVLLINRSLNKILESPDINKRPLLAESPEKIYDLYEEREDFYKIVSKLEIDNNSTVLDAIIDFVHKV